MKASFILSLYLFLLLGTSSISAQSEMCDSFCITKIRMDSLVPNVMNVTILFIGDENDFINYPYVSAVVDLNGDTVGTGTLNFFGHFGGTSQDYPVNTIFDELPGNFRAYAHFNFDTLSCVLDYLGAPCFTTSVLLEDANDNIKIYPNPFSSQSVIEAHNFNEELTMTLFNSQGQLVHQIHHRDGNHIILERNGLPAGSYFLKLQDHHHVSVLPVIIIN